MSQKRKSLGVFVMYTLPSPNIGWVYTVMNNKYSHAFQPYLKLSCISTFFLGSGFVQRLLLHTQTVARNLSFRVWRDQPEIGWVVGCSCHLYGTLGHSL